MGKWKNRRAYIALIVVCAAMAIIFTASRTATYKVVETGEIKSEVCPVMEDGVVYRQEISGYDGVLSGLYLMPGTFGKKLSGGVLIAELLDEEGNRLAYTSIECTGIRDNKRVYIPIGTAELDGGQPLELSLTVQAMEEGDMLAFWLADGGLPPYSIGGSAEGSPLFLLLEEISYKSQWPRAYPFLGVLVALLACYPLAGKEGASGIEND